MNAPYRTLVAAMSADVRADVPALLASIADRPAPPIAAAALRHRCGAALCAALEPLRRDDVCARSLHALLRSERWTSTLRAGRVRAEALHVLGVLESSGIEAVALKGAQRVLLHAPEADVFESQDLDVLVEPHAIEDAARALESVGYRQSADETAYAQHHHAAPLVRGGALAVELHHALSPQGVPAANTLSDLRAHVREIDVDGRRVRVLDNVAAALHLAVHCVRSRPLREPILLALQLRRMDAFELNTLRGLIEREAHDATALQGCIAFAAAIAGIDWPCPQLSHRFSEWMLLREDLPRPLRARIACVDAWLSSPQSPLRSALRAAFADARGGTLALAGRGVLNLLSAGAIVPYAALRRR